MEPFAEVLLAGGHSNSLGRSGEVLELLRRDPARLDELFACIAADDAWVRMRAVDTFEKLVREDPPRGVPYTERVLDELTASDQPSVQWHTAQLFGLLTLTDAQRRRAVDWLLARVATTDVDWIVSAQSMATLVALHDEGAVPTEDLVQRLEVQTGHHSASVRRKASAFLEAVRRS
ncbi:hypothetical protein [Phycicoccus sonneratiae]|uniref:HEAT repeat domain-containing protein n=1 Tax=Phycicoccus sonneratiae TaxID=2807628 RepID=A0ABS2CQU8_9MICO|nr:hypothetical protein [Phycicoccus sonneraticus]MBM6402252.1 hypothetical protein [Phycicoccus sonneraticus]